MARRQHGVVRTPDDGALKTFGQLLWRYRREGGLTQEQLAERSGISVRAIGDLERGVKHRPRDATVELLADALHLSDPQRARLLASVSQRGGTIGAGQPRDGTRLPIVPVQPTYPLLTSSPFVGREVVLSSVRETFRDSNVRPGRVRDTDRLGLVLITGDAGIGKTRVLAELAWHAQERRLLVLAGGCYEAEGRLPLGALHDAVLDYIEAQGDEVLQVQLGGLLPELARMVPELRDRFPDLTEGHVISLEEQRPRIFWAVSRLFERISEVRPLVLLLDDLQWADETTVELLHFLARQPQLDRILIVGAYRPRDTPVSANLEQLLAPGTRGAPVCRSDLQPMDLADLTAVLGIRLGGACAAGLARAVHERSGGNPFFALEIIELLHQQGQLRQASIGKGDHWILNEGSEIELPTAVRVTVAQRLKGLDPEVVEVLRLVAVAGRRVAYTTLTDLWEAGERSLLSALDTAVSAQILEESGTGYAFRHPVLQEVVYRELSAAHRAWLHARVAGSLEEMYATRADEHASELAYHFVAGGRDGARSLHYLSLAGDAAVRASAWQEALHAYRIALQYASTDLVVADTEERIGMVLKALGRYDEALVALDDAGARYERMGDLERVGQVTAVSVGVHALRGSWEEGRAQATRVIGQLDRLNPTSDDRSRILADLYLALTYLYDSGLEERLHEAGQAADLARAVGDAGLLPRAEMRRSFMLYALRRFAEAQEAINALIPLAEEVGDSSTLRFAVDILADIHKLEGRLEECLHGRERALAYAEERPDEPHWIMVSLAQLAEARFLLGDWTEARALYERAVQMSRVYPAPHYAAFALLGLGALDLAEGRWEEATDLIGMCNADAERTNDAHWVGNAERLLAHRDLLLDRPDEALLRLADQGEDHTGTLYLRGWGYLETGDVQRAAATADRAISLARERSNGLDLCEALIVRGRIDARQSCFEDVERSFTEALSLARSLPYPYAEGRALHARGIVDSQRGEHSRARESMVAAQAIFERLGATPCLEQTPAVIGE